MSVAKILALFSGLNDAYTPPSLRLRKVAQYTPSIIERYRKYIEIAVIRTANNELAEIDSGLT